MLGEFEVCRRGRGVTGQHAAAPAGRGCGQAAVAQDLALPPVDLSYWPGWRPESASAARAAIVTASSKSAPAKSNTGINGGW